MTSELSSFAPRPLPGQVPLLGTRVRIEPLQDHHFAGLYEATGRPENDDIWRFMPCGPFHTSSSQSDFLSDMVTQQSWRIVVFLAAETHKELGMATFLRVRPEHGSCEIGMVAHGQAMRRRPEATEVHYLLARHVFEDLGYRRYEWKCNAANDASMAAARRYGFTFEGIFRQDMVVKGENRDTAWWSMLDHEWPAIKARYEAWLDPANFDAEGRQRRPLYPNASAA